MAPPCPVRSGSWRLKAGSSGPRRRWRAAAPVATSHAAIEQAAFWLFDQRGFAATTLDDIAREAGVGRRTLFRYYDSKIDITWGRFDHTLDRFRALLDEQPVDTALPTSIHRAVVEFNRFPADAYPRTVSGCG